VERLDLLGWMDGWVPVVIGSDGGCGICVLGDCLEARDGCVDGQQLMMMMATRPCGVSWAAVASGWMMLCKLRFVLMIAGLSPAAD
jgi:hypothetical protein